MKYILLIAFALAVGCGDGKGGGNQITVTVSGVTMAEVNSARDEIGKMSGVYEVTTGDFKDGTVTFTVRYSGKGQELATEFGKSAGGLKNVKGFNESALSVDFGGAPVTAENKPKPEQPKATQPVNANAGRPKDMPKDPLAYKIKEFSGGSIATFDGWKIVPAGGDGNYSVVDTCPEGREKDFAIRLIAGTPDAGEMENLFQLGPQVVQSWLPGFSRTSNPKELTIAGDPAMTESYEGPGVDGKKKIVRVIYIRKKDVAVGVMGIGTEAGQKEFGRAIDIMAQSITLKESPLEPELLGTWHYSSYKSSGTGSSQFSYSSATSITIYANGTFSEYHSSDAGGASTGSMYSENSKRGTVVKRGNLLTFHYDDGKTWTPEYKLEGGGLMLNGTAYFRQ